LYSSNWPYNTSSKLITYRLFHHHGDAFLNIYTEVPQALSVSHNSTLLGGSSSFSVTANSGSLIALSVNNEIIATADGTGSSVAISIPSQDPSDEVLVTITKQNYYRYSSVVDVIPPSGPYMNFESYSINDVGGNNNNIADYGEDISLDITLENAGSSSAFNVTSLLSSTDSYVIITDANQSFGTIVNGETSIQINAFSISISNSIPDQHIVNFNLQIDGDSDQTWNSSFSITVNALN